MIAIIQKQTLDAHSVPPTRAETVSAPTQPSPASLLGQMDPAASTMKLDDVLLGAADATSPLEYPPFPRGNTIPDPRSVEEHGRLWQNYRPDKYFLPNDAIEQDRLDFSNAAFRCLLDGALHLAPVHGDPAHVLDIGTGTGRLFTHLAYCPYLISLLCVCAFLEIWKQGDKLRPKDANVQPVGVWAIQYAQEHPGSRVIGSDLSLIQPDVGADVPNVEFVREDSEEPVTPQSFLRCQSLSLICLLKQWIHDEPFDFIHSRLMFTCFNNPRDVLRQAYANLKPGGWIEYQDLLFNVDSDDGSHLGSGIHRWSHLANLGAAAKRRDVEVARKYKDYLSEAGFVDIVEARYKFFGNPWPGPARERDMQLGMYIEIIGAEVVRTISTRLLGEGLGIPVDAVNAIVTQAQKDITDRSIHFYWPVYVVYGRKPF
ncbi:hypothetical protein PG996_011230 [Apiospora saccharicola]|uniref:S-adenosyl-L-methionine-dependent methyltransferase n=1 Tax=Apiospora saccharicola TaxID=335842 RepID=A0ABR1UEG9_9PEZI